MTLASRPRHQSLGSVVGLAIASLCPMIAVGDTWESIFDWRELEGWGIPAIVVGVGVVLVQAGLIIALLFQRVLRRRAEKEAIDLTGRLLIAHEDERRYLAREMHDDLTQRLARLAIDAGRMEENGLAAPEGMRLLREDLVRLSEDVHALSYRLHPSMLDDLGLVEALKAECDRVGQHGSPRVKMEAREVPEELAPETSLCLYRVAQEALSNAVRHARASAVSVLLSQNGKGLQLTVSDNGRGFDPAVAHGHASLGLASMRERVRLLRGELDIESTPGRGTSVVAWLPVVRKIP
jgi:signal transduction histidine kinase